MDQRTVEVGIMSAGVIEFELIRPEERIRKKAVLSNGRILCDGSEQESFFFPAEASESVFSSPAFVIFGVTIGIGFHWERKQDQTFAGSLKLIVSEDRIVAVNVIGVEDYLVSVISSEMKSSASLNLLKAHAVISRSWLLAQIENRKSGKRQPSGSSIPGTMIRWWNHEDHTAFDVCADDHCQRYQGLTNALGDNVRIAVEETWGQVLKYNGELCDARFSKCCGGVMERFSTCWEDKDYPYLQPLADEPEGGGRCFCDTQDESILSQVLNAYDLETKDFFRWKVSYPRELLSDLVRRRSGIDFGEIRSLEPLEKGESGRISRLRIIGSTSTAIVGKELMIRRLLSESHLKSSAFEVEWNGDVLTLNGRGWGHGVGLCQIGAAVMAHQGYDYKRILSHYYPGTSIEP